MDITPQTLALTGITTYAISYLMLQLVIFILRLPRYELERTRQLDVSVL